VKEVQNKSINNAKTGSEHLQERPNVVLLKYPVDAEQFSPDLAPHVEEIIRRHGLEEWKAAILTNEMHRHLGIYSIIGVKMGIRAREILKADLDELTVFSFTGFSPPVSCMTDGLQVATGASLGRGTINVKDLRPGEPAAIFKSAEGEVKLVLNNKCREEVDKLIRSFSHASGHESHAYFDEIRKFSIGFWLDNDRNDIFEVYNNLNHKNHGVDGFKK
jgi:pyrimidine-specific ribonucleoside hydrolase